ncbi:UDP-N-acetylmuramoyl-tripeptide--D-alanyl-D-alanine ligase [Candidatus Uhrbacteria bacterium]|nr:UDP-N-acetylmuramoyl-tripeptide--D-alanyl-D-alanine ligase [Candidatus Uhrbacteria bacterium]
MKKLAIKFLAICAKAVLKKYQPKIVAITGTVGKSSAKEAAFAVLRRSLVVRASRSNYNTEIGAPLTILDLPAPGRSVLKWIRVILRTVKLLAATDHSYPDVLILEMGADRPGDIKKLADIAAPHAAIITAITPVHLEKFISLSEVRKEKLQLWAGVRPNGTVIGNADDPSVAEEIKKIKRKIISYGTENGDIMAGEIMIFAAPGEFIEEQVRGIAFKLYADGSVLPVHIDGVLGRSHALAAASGAACGAAFGLNYHDIVEGLHGYAPLPGRMRLIPGIKHTLLIDDSYNASPAAMNKAMEELAAVPIAENNKHYAILGDMLELGSESVNYHIEIGRRAVELGVDVLICVGELGAEIMKAAKEAGMDEGKVFHFGISEEAGLFAQERIKTGDVILIKGSRGMRMEKAVLELMAEPEKAEEILVRE